MRKILLILGLLVTSLMAYSQSWALEGLVVGSPPTNMATIDSIKYTGGVLYHYIGGLAVPSTGYLTKTGSYLSPSNAGDDFLLATATEIIAWGDASTYIREESSGNLGLSVNNSLSLNLSSTAITIYNHLIPYTTSIYDLGSSTKYYRELYVDSVNTNLVYIESSTTKIFENPSGNLTFSDAITGTKTLADIISASTATALISTINCSYNDTTYLTVGDTLDVGLNFMYEATRDMTDSLSQTGTILLNYDSITNNVSYTSMYTGSDIKLDVKATRIGSDIKLMLIVDNTNTNDLTFKLYSSLYSSVDSITVSDINKVISYTTCADNDTTYINIGVTTTDVGFYMNYQAERNMGTIQKEFGDILIMYDDVADSVFYFPESIGFDLGLTIKADVNGTDIRLMIIVDNSTAYDLLFDDKIISKFYEQ